MAPRWFWLIAGWSLAGCVVLTLILRALTPTGPLAVAVVSLAPLVGVGAAGAAISAWRAASRPLVVAAAAIVLLYGFTFGSIRAVVGCGGESAEDEIVLYDHNVEVGMGDPVAVAEAIGAAGADIVVLQEVYPLFAERLAARPEVAALPHRETLARSDPTGLAVWSRWPIIESDVVTLVDLPMIRAVIDTPTGPLEVYAVHTSAPYSADNVDRWDAQLRLLATIRPDRPTVLAGDFNATTGHAQFRGLLRQGWTDAHRPKGCGLGTTWPARGRIPPLLRLDHVLVDDRIDVLGLELGPAGGGDHRAVIATLRIAVSGT